MEITKTSPVDFLVIAELSLRYFHWNIASLLWYLSDIIVTFNMKNIIAIIQKQKWN